MTDPAKGGPSREVSVAEIHLAQCVWAIGVVAVFIGLGLLFGVITMPKQLGAIDTKLTDVITIGIGLIMAGWTTWTYGFE